VLALLRVHPILHVGRVRVNSRHLIIRKLCIKYGGHMFGGHMFGGHIFGGRMFEHLLYISIKYSILSEYFSGFA